MIRLPLASASTYPALRVARARPTSSSIGLHVGGRAAVQRARERPDRRRERRAAVGAGRGDDPRGERRCVQPVLGRADPVGVDRLARAAGRPRRASGAGTSPPRSCPARPRRRAPARHGRRRRGPTARRSTSSAPRGGRGRPRLLVGDVDELAEPPLRPRVARLRLEVGRRVAGQPRGLVRLGVGMRRARGRRRRAGPRRSRTGSGRRASSMSTPR